jgi:hypothetical protein
MQVRMPSQMRNPGNLTPITSQVVKQAVCKAGDVVIFTEALTHGTMPWTADVQRRSVLFRYSPANSAHAGGRHPFDADHRAGPAWPMSWYEGLTDAQRAVLVRSTVTSSGPTQADGSQYVCSHLCFACRSRRTPWPRSVHCLATTASLLQRAKTVSTPAAAKIDLESHPNGWPRRQCGMHPHS